MGVCFSCSKSSIRFKDKGTKICSSLQSAVSPHHSQQHAVIAEEIASCRPRNGVPLKRRRDRKRQSMSNAIKTIVSKRRNRYKKDGFNLDLTYITKNIIAMGYPASNIEGVYRNSIDDVARFLDIEHKEHYRVYNLCSERTYDTTKFHDRVEHFPFDDHNPPKIELIQPFCQSVHKWLSEPCNVAVVHCKAGKGRTGTMICCYLLHSRLFTDPQEALLYYANQRTQDQKGVTIPSQVRYVHYYGKLLQGNVMYSPEVLYIKQIRLEPPPLFVTVQGSVCFSILQQDDRTECNTKITERYKSGMYDVKRNQNPFVIELDSCDPIVGDVKVKFYTKKLYKEKQFHFWMNTFFVAKYNETNGDGDIELTLKKCELDIVNKKDKQNKAFTEDFKVTVVFRRVPRDPLRWGGSPHKLQSSFQSNNQPQQDTTPSESSEAETTESDSVDEEDVWDSGESGFPYRSIRKQQRDSVDHSDNNGDDETWLSFPIEKVKN